MGCNNGNLSGKAWRERESKPVTPPGPGDVEQYRTTHRKDFVPFNSNGYCSMRVLPELTGRKLDAMVLGWIQALNPRCIRVTTGEVKCDSVIGRVTVVVDEQDVIRDIEQEVRVGLPPGVPNGGAMFEYLYGNWGGSVDLDDALERAVSALEYRVHVVETEDIPQAENKERNIGVLSALLEGVTNDMRAATELRKLIGKKQA